MPKGPRVHPNGKYAKLIRLYVLARDSQKYATLKRDTIAAALKSALRSAEGHVLDTETGIARLHLVQQQRFDQKKAKVVLGPRFEECYSTSDVETLDVQPNRESEMAAASREFASVTEPDDAPAKTDTPQ